MREGADSDPLELYRHDRFRIERVEAPEPAAEYDRFLRSHYEPLGFFCEQVLPASGSLRFQLRHGAELAAIFRLTPVEDADSAYFALVPGAVTADGRRRRLLEVNNVVIGRPFRASIALGLILYRSACEAIERRYDFVVGMNRLQVLRFFVDFGVVPVAHPPERVLGKDHLLDFVNYYDTSDPASIAYMHERARRYFHQELVMQSIQRHHRGTGPVRPASVAARSRVRT